jgi:hypothetical protein
MKKATSEGSGAAPVLEQAGSPLRAMRTCEHDLDGPSVTALRAAALVAAALVGQQELREASGL